MASSPRKSSSSNHHSDEWSPSTDDSSLVGYPLIRKPGRTALRRVDLFPSMSSDSQESINTAKTTPEAATSTETPVNEEAITMNIHLEDVSLVQLFLRPNGSVKGLCFNYRDSDLAELGCCVAEPGCWSAWIQPRWLLFTPSPGHAVGRGFFPVKKISFAGTDDLPETGMKVISMWSSMMFRLSAGRLEIDIGRRTVRSGQRSFKRSLRAVKGWFQKNSVLSQLSTKVRDVGNKASRLVPLLRNSVGERLEDREQTIRRDLAKISPEALRSDSESPGAFSLIGVF